jgi:hypothetical protein
VEDGNDHCAAGHFSPPTTGPSLPGRIDPALAAGSPGAPFKFEDLVESSSHQARAAGEVSPSSARAPIHPPLVFDTEDGEVGEMNATEVVEWAHAGATNADVVWALRENGVTPIEGSLPVVLANGDRVPMVAAVEAGAIEAYDAPMVATTWPGEGWTFVGDRFSWERSLSTETLAGAAREFESDEERFNDDQELGARFAYELSRQSSNWNGADLLVTRDTSGAGPEEGWRSGLPEDLFRSAARETFKALVTGSDGDSLADYTRRWLGKPTPGPTVAAV